MNAKIPMSWRRITKGAIVHTLDDLFHLFDDAAKGHDFLWGIEKEWFAGAINYCSAASDKHLDQLFGENFLIEDSFWYWIRISFGHANDVYIFFHMWCGDRDKIKQPMVFVTGSVTMEQVQMVIDVLDDKMRRLFTQILEEDEKRFQQIFASVSYRVNSGMGQNQSIWHKIVSTFRNRFLSRHNQ